MRLTRIILALCAFLSGSILSAQDWIVVTAPEAPFPFEPLEMFVFPNKDFPITKYGAKPGDVKANTAASRRPGFLGRGGMHERIPARLCLRMREHRHFRPRDAGPEDGFLADVVRPS